MGKKTLEDIAKLILMSFITFILTSVGVKRTMMDSKVDKVEYESDQKQRWEAHDKVQEKNNEQAAETYEMVKWLYQDAIKKNN